MINPRRASSPFILKNTAKKAHARMRLISSHEAAATRLRGLLGESELGISAAAQAQPDCFARRSDCSAPDTGEATTGQVDNVKFCIAVAYCARVGNYLLVDGLQ